MMNNRVLRTPLPPPVDSEVGLTFKPSQRPWVKLLRSLDSTFAQDGRSGQITAAGQIPVSPTQYVGQSTVWLRSDQDTMYRFEKRVRVWRLQVVETPSSVAHVRLLPHLPTSQTPFDSIQAPRERYQTNRATVVYTKDVLSIMFGDTPLEVKMHTGVTLKKRASRHQRPGDKILNANPANMFYIAEVYVETQSFEWAPCGRGLTASSFESLTQDKVDQLHRRVIQPHPRVVPAETLSPQRRQQLSSLREDIHE
ncbi:hypothetical protein GSI_01901 [Ganoderma sinense ZZ0214-1]|uniref:Uncharacterized protein n=1 Tax=Ganoderma sinense ZZ0214-1 TaxID=1077348 RepID=A0A2G8SR45_9APHY|nr:hypothetical protein GSI_01901 [Ganoderma sinense ZZ0214-1]